LQYAAARHDAEQRFAAIDQLPLLRIDGGDDTVFRCADDDTASGFALCQFLLDGRHIAIKLGHLNLLFQCGVDLFVLLFAQFASGANQITLQILLTLALFQQFSLLLLEHVFGDVMLFEQMLITRGVFFRQSGARALSFELRLQGFQIVLECFYFVGQRALRIVVECSGLTQLLRQRLPAQFDLTADRGLRIAHGLAGAFAG